MNDIVVPEAAVAESDNQMNWPEWYGPEQQLACPSCLRYAQNDPSNDERRLSAPYSRGKTSDMVDP